MPPNPVNLQQLNRTFIGSVLFIDIVGYSKHPVSDQLALKEIFNQLLIGAIRNVAEAERILVDTGDGAAAAFLGDPEDALFTALGLRDAIAETNIPLAEKGFVRMGINLGPLKVVRDINGHTNMIGDGVNDAQRIMSFAEPGQVVVAHSFYDIISRFSRDYAKLFVYEGTRQDKHVREHEVYRLGQIDEAEKLAEMMRRRSHAKLADERNATWQPGAPGYHSVRVPMRKEPDKKRFPLGPAIAVAAGVSLILAAAAWWFWSASRNAAPAAAQAPPAASTPAARLQASPAAPEAAKSDTAAKPADPGSPATHPAAEASVKKAAAPAKPAEKAKPAKCKFLGITVNCGEVPNGTPQGY